MLRNVCAAQRRYCVKGSFCMICSIRNGGERLACLAGICITIPGIHYYFALTNDGRLGPRRDVFTGIFDKGRNLGPSSEEDRTHRLLLCAVSVRLNPERRFHFPGS